MKLIQIAFASTLSFSLCACSDSGASELGGLVSTPPPVPTPTSTPAPAPAPTLPPGYRVVVSTIPSPATKVGTYDTIAVIDATNAAGTRSTRLAQAGEVRLQTEPAASRYTMLFTAPEIPFASDAHMFGQRSVYPYGVAMPFGNDAAILRDSTDGTTSVAGGASYRTGTSEVVVTDPTAKRAGLLIYDVGFSYVSLGDWLFVTLVPDPSGRFPNLVVSPSARLKFVVGDRTPAAAIPLSGTATYTGSSLGYHTDATGWNLAGFGGPIDILLRADFSQHSMHAELTRSFSVVDDVSTTGVDLRGTGNIDLSGTFLVPLTGRLLAWGTVVPANGDLNGAFFGPNAEQVGGVFAVSETPGTTLVSDAFVGVKN